MKYFSKIRENLKPCNRVNILLSEHPYRPMGPRVASQLFSKRSANVHKLSKVPASVFFVACWTK